MCGGRLHQRYFGGPDVSLAALKSRDLEKFGRSSWRPPTVLVKVVGAPKIGGVVVERCILHATYVGLCGSFTLFTLVHDDSTEVQEPERICDAVYGLGGWAFRFRGTHDVGGTM